MQVYKISSLLRIPLLKKNHFLHVSSQILMNYFKVIHFPTWSIFQTLLYYTPSIALSWLRLDWAGFPGLASGSSKARIKKQRQRAVIYFWSLYLDWMAKINDRSLPLFFYSSFTGPTSHSHKPCSIKCQSEAYSV